MCTVYTVYKYKYTYIYIYICMHIYLYVHVYYTIIYIYTCKYIYIHIYMFIYSTYLYTFVLTHVISICRHMPYIAHPIHQLQGLAVRFRHRWQRQDLETLGWRWPVYGQMVVDFSKTMVRWNLDKDLWSDVSHLVFFIRKTCGKPESDFSGWFSDWHGYAWYLAWFSSRRVLFFQLTSAPTFCGFYCASQVKVHLSPSNKLFTFEVVCCKTVAPWRFSGRFFSWSFCDILWKDDDRCSTKSGWSVQAWQEANCTGFYLYFPISAANFGFVAFISD